MNELLKAVKDLRIAQREYERTKDWQIAQICNVIGHRVDVLIEKYENMDDLCM